MHEVLLNDAWLICTTVPGFGFDTVLNMTDEDREWWAERCEEYRQKEAESGGGGAHGY